MIVPDTLHPNPAIARHLAYLYGLARHKAVDLGFRPPYMALLKALGDPHKHLPPVIHVAGTNGKGSTIAFLRAALEGAGYSVNTYTSPHLIAFNERIVLKSQMIQDDTLLTLLEEVMSANADAPITFFEVTTALAFLAFARTPADVLLLEVGMGGRLDCTNVIERPAACALTSLSLDHAEHLGPDLAAITREKAGIMKTGAPCIVARQESPEVVHPLLTQTAHQVGAPLLLHDREEDMENLSLIGDHQKDNAQTAQRVLLTLSDTFPMDYDTMRSTMAKAQWPARLQKLDIPWVPQLWTVWLDGGHNPGAARTLAAWAAQSDAPLHLIVGLKSDKDVQGFLAPLHHLMTSITYTPLPGPHHVFPNMRPWDDAIRHIVTHNDPPGRILITGSLYLAGEVLRKVSA